MFGKRLSRALAVTVTATLALTAAAFANDKLTSDASLVTDDLQQSYTNNALADGATANFSFSLYVEVVNGGQEPTYPIKVDVASMPSWVTALSTFPLTINGTGTGNAVTASFQATGQAAAASDDIVFKALASDGITELSQSDLQTNAQSTFHVSVSPPSTPPSNDPPVVGAGGPYSGAEGSDIALDGGSASDTDGTIASTSWSIVDQSSIDSPGSCSITTPSSLAGATTKCTDNGSATVSLSATDDDGATSTANATVNVSNALPVIPEAAFSSASASCPTDAAPDNVSLSITFTDAGSADTHKAEVDWDNNGGYEQTVDPYTSGTGIPHSYGSAGSHTAKVRITDDDGGVSATTPTASVTVNYNLSSILQPINDTRNGQAASLFKYGSTIPVKVEVTDCDGSHPNNLTLKVTYRKGLNATPAGVDEVIPTSQADLGNTMRFSDPLYVLQLNSKLTTDDATSGVTIWVTIQETGQQVSANIGFKK